MPFPSPRPSRYTVRVARGTSGLGLFASEDIPAHRFVIEYWGKIISDTEAERVSGRYLFDLGNGKNVSGGTRKNIARYANHACRPNCESRTVGNRVYIYSLKRIKAGDEITYDYGKEYFDGFITTKKCRCKTCMKRRSRET